MKCTTEGQPFERGVIEGKLSEDLIKKSRKIIFAAEIFKMIPSQGIAIFSRYFIGWFNRNLLDYVLPEFKEEIYGISQSASDDYVLHWQQNTSVFLN